MAASTAQDDWVNRVLGIKFVPPETAALTKRLEAVGAGLQALRASNPNAAAPLLQGFPPAVVAVRSAAPEAAGLVAALERAVAQANAPAGETETPAANAETPDAGTTDTGTTDTKAPVDFGRLLQRWQQARSRAVANLDALVNRVRGSDAAQTDNRFTALEPVLGDVQDLMPKFGNKLESLLQALASKGVDPGTLREAGKMLDTYQRRLAAVPELQALEAFASKHLGGGLPLESDLRRALADVQVALADAA